MENIVNLTGRGILRRLRAIEETPVSLRRGKFGRGWPWMVVNGQNTIRERHPELSGEMEAIYRPRTWDELTPVGSGFPSRKIEG